jgi:phospholipid-transporting ATPase
VLRARGFESTTWQSLLVGDIVRIDKDEQIPADLLLLYSGEDKGNCFVETKNLDGETNLKEKRASSKLQALFEGDPMKLYDRQLEFKFEGPNPYLYSFTGNISLPSQELLPLDNSNFVLRGCSLRNTNFVYGVVTYNGHESKIMLNSVKAQPKMSLLERMMNGEIVRIVILQMSLCVAFAILSVVYQEFNKAQLKYMEFDKDTTFDSVWFIAWPLYLGKWLLILNNFIPISLMVSHEMVKYTQAMLVAKDDKMASTLYGNIRTVVQSSSLTEELGQIDYIFSDKTGTLTCNIMDFKKLYAGGEIYGHEYNDEAGEKYPDFPNVAIRDPKLFEVLEDPAHPKAESLRRSLRFLSLCHTALIEGEIPTHSYCTSSPDELALVNFARFGGYEFRGLDKQDNYHLSMLDGSTQTLKVLYTLEFNSKRKRMSVIFKDETTGKILLLCKGADSVIAKRLAPGQADSLKQAFQALEDFGKEGLRTLMLAEREIPEEEFKTWETNYKAASTSMKDREELMEAQQDLIEVGLDMVGCTAIEDKLQDEVPETIELLLKANIKLWVLTGDKVETAMTIAMSCKLIDLTTEVLIIDEVDREPLKKQMQAYKDKVTTSVEHDFSIFVVGDSLIKISEFGWHGELVDIADKCQSFVACRVSPKQKQELVQMVRDAKPEAVTLAIGDGANDVNMISGAHVGVGIKGLEGSQAARVSDFAIGEFKLLRRLVLAYGREFYRLNSDLIGYFFYKNLIVVLPQIWIAVATGFSGQVVYEPFIFEFYNICFTSIPVLIYAIWDRQFDLDLLQNAPSFYKIGPNREMFNTRHLFQRWIGRAAMQSFLICFFAFFMIEYNFVSNGLLHDFWTTGMAVFTAVIIVANLELFNIHNSHSTITYFFIFGSIGIYVIVLTVFSSFKSNPLYMCLYRLLVTPNFYIFLFTVIYICSVFVSSVHKIMHLMDKIHFKRISSPEGIRRRNSSFYRRQYTGFAYSG